MDSLLVRPAVLVTVEVGGIPAGIPPKYLVDELLLNIKFGAHWPSIEIRDNYPEKIDLLKRCPGPLILSHEKLPGYTHQGFLLHLHCARCGLNYSSNSKSTWESLDFVDNIGKWLLDAAFGYGSSMFNSIFVELRNPSQKISCFHTRTFLEKECPIPVYLALMPNMNLYKLATHAAYTFLTTLKEISIRYERETKKVFRRD